MGHGGRLGGLRPLCLGSALGLLPLTGAALVRGYPDERLPPVKVVASFAEWTQLKRATIKRLWKYCCLPFMLPRLFARWQCHSVRYALLLYWQTNTIPMKLCGPLGYPLCLTPR